MKVCPQCNESSDDQFDSCWRCSAPLPGDKTVRPTRSALPYAPRKVAKFQIFRGTFATWNELCGEAAEFASAIGPQNLITISHSEDRDDGVITVWFWTDDSATPPRR